jgi:acetyl-CoA acetyltransferase
MTGWAGRGRTAIAGLGFSEVTRAHEIPLGRLTLTACARAIADAALESSQIDGLATFPDQPFRGAGNREGEDLVPVTYVLNHLDLASDVRWYAQLSQGMAPSALIEAAHALIAGACDYALVWRAMHRPAGTYGAWRSDEATGEAQFSAPYGFTSPFQTHGVAYRRYMHRFGATRQHMAAVATTQRANANRNPRAWFRDTPMSVDDYLAARIISDPLCLFDCDIPVEGAVAMVLTTAERARDLPNPPAYLAGYGQNTQQALAVTPYVLGSYMEAGASTAGKLWASSGLGPEEMSAAELYDGFSPTVYYWLESAGFCPEGEASRFVQDGRIALDGELPVNTFGGSLSEGRLHGMGHVAEAALQVTGRAGERQIRGASAVAAFAGSPLLRGSAVVLTSEP